MIVHYLYVFRAIVGPDKTDTPLVVDTDLMLALTVIGQGFQPVTRRRPQVVQIYRGLKHGYFPQSSPEYVIREALSRLARQHLLHQLALGALYHGLIRIMS